MANFEKQNVQDMVTRFLATKNGTYVKDGNIYLDGGEQSAIVSFLPDNKIEVKLSNRHPKREEGTTIYQPETMSEALEMANGLYTQIYPIEQ